MKTSFVLSIAVKILVLAVVDIITIRTFEVHSVKLHSGEKASDLCALAFSLPEYKPYTHNKKKFRSAHSISVDEGENEEKKPLMLKSDFRKRSFYLVRAMKA